MENIKEFKNENSNKEARNITYLEAIREAMQQMMRADSNVYLIGEDVAEYGGAFGVSVGMLEEFGKERIINTPISEDAIIGVATGGAVTGMRPIAEIMFSDFNCRRRRNWCSRSAFTES